MTKVLRNISTLYLRPVHFCVRKLRGYSIVLMVLLLFSSILNAQITSTGVGGLWSNPATWVGGIAPVAGNDVVIANGSVVTVDVDATGLNSLTVGQGSSGILEYEITTPRIVTVAGNVTIAAGALFISAPSFSGSTITTHSLVVGENLINNGMLNFSAESNNSGVLITFTGAADAAFDCSGATLTNLRRTGGITLNKGAATFLNFIPGGTFQVLSANTAGFLTIASGTFKIIGTNAFSNPVFDVASYTIPTSGGIWIDNASATIVGQFGSTLLSGGLLRITNGIFNLGTTAGNTLTYSNTPRITIEGGSFNVAGRICPSTAFVSTIIYSQSGGTVTVVTQGSASATFAGFDIGAAGSSFTMSDGRIVIQRATNNVSDYLNLASTNNVTGGTIQIGNGSTPAVQTIRVNSSVPAYNFTIDNSSATLPAASLVTNNLTINNQLTLNGHLLLNNQNLVLGSTALPIAGTLNAANGMIVCNNGLAGGEIRKIYSVNGSYTFPVGDNNITAEYSPVTLNFTSGTYAGSAYAAVKVINAKHPNNANTTNFTNRYWSINSSSIATPTYNIDATYLIADIVGSDFNIAMGKYTALPWVKYGAANTVTKTLTATGVTNTGIVGFSGISLDAPTVNITPIAPTICVGSSVTLTANATGDPTITYLWSPGGETTSSITVSPASTTTYSVTITDGNGLTASASETVTVSALPTTANAGADQNICSTTATLAGNTATVGTGVWTLVSGAGTITTPGSPTSGITGLSVGANTFRWTISNAPCTASFDEVVITRSDVPTTANAGPDQTVCATTATLAGNIAAIGTGVWTLVSGTGTITTPGSPTSGIIGLGVGANTFRWTILNAPCTPSVDEVIVTRSDDPTTANAGADQT